VIETERIVNTSKFNLLKFQQNYLTALMNKLYLEPEDSGEFCNLFAGTSLPESIKIDPTKSPRIPLELISRIAKYNSFGTTNAEVENWISNQFPIYSAIWITPSFANHSCCCDFNASCSFHEDFIFVRAVKDIKCVNEILVPYVSLVLTVVCSMSVLTEIE